MVVFNELLQAVGNVLPELLRLTSFQLLGHSVLGLYDLEFTLIFWQDDLADAEIGSSHVQGKECAFLVASRVSQNPSRIHRL